ncbi:AP-4 complex accessory subunit Tepsin [Galemys pyrenaicus]|uniref:AP-4 complex accessory subunit Tepsin n=1 Tax=Galemys pyrenaicus TaxID=202257 RepID=A0A8J6DFF5_GALPY|nr:AP-4 complex accessory subunit Tepsin [Galemys pyrenaicus]
MAGPRASTPASLTWPPEISHESLGSSQCLLEYLLNRLRGGSGHVKLKVLRILLHLRARGSPAFLLLLKRNAAFIQEAAVFAGPPDPLHGNSLYQKVRAAAQVSPAGRFRSCLGDGAAAREQRTAVGTGGQLPPAPLSRCPLVQDLGSALFSDSPSPPPAPPPRALPPAGMGSQSRPQGALQGFGYSSRERAQTGSAGEVFLSTIQKAAEVVAHAVRPGPESPSAQRPLPRGDTYQPAVTPSAGLGHPPAGKLPPGAVPGARAVRALVLSAARHQPGQAGGGWDELESSPQPQSSSHGSSGLSEASGVGSRSGSDSPPGASGAPSDLTERAEALTPRDCQQELSLVQAVTRGPRAFLSREEAQHFIRECGRLNCEAVLELLIRQLDGASECGQMRALGALATLGGSDLLAQEHVLLLARPRLQELSVGSPGPVTSKATKVLRHFEASCGQRPPAPRPVASPEPAAACRGPSDLLADAVPFLGGPASLQPLSSTPFPPPGSAPVWVPSAPRDGAAPPGPQDTGDTEDRLAGPGDHGAGPEPTDSPERSGSSLFAGMELVACPRWVGAGATAEEPPPAPCDPWTSVRRAAAEGPPSSEPSAFAFLNV